MLGTSVTVPANGALHHGVIELTLRFVDLRLACRYCGCCGVGDVGIAAEPGKLDARLLAATLEACWLSFCSV